MHRTCQKRVSWPSRRSLAVLGLSGWKPQRVILLGVYWDKEKENGNYYNGFIYGLGWYLVPEEMS